MQLKLTILANAPNLSIRWSCIEGGGGRNKRPETGFFQNTSKKGGS